MRHFKRTLVFSGLIAATASACASAPHDAANESPDIHAWMEKMNSRLDSLETRMGTLNDKIKTAQAGIDNLAANRRAVPTAVSIPPSEGAGTDPVPAQVSNDPETGFEADSAIQEYRKASILLQAGKYPEAVLAFSGFVDKYPDHPLAGSAQFGVGEAYFKQKEYKLALREFEHVLTSYDRSPHVSDTLRDMAEAEDALHQPEQAARHRQLLTSLFAQSPAAAAALKPAHPQNDVPEPPTQAAPAGDQAEEPAESPAAASSPTAQESTQNSRSTYPHLDEPPPPADTTAAAPKSELPTAPLAAPEGK